MEKCRYLPWGDAAILEFTTAAVKLPHLAPIYQGAIEAVSIADQVNLKYPGHGCVLSVIAFTHGQGTALKLIRMPADNTKLDMVEMTAKKIASTNTQNFIIKLDIEKFTPPTLNNFLQQFPTAWILVHKTLFQGHIIGIRSYGKNMFAVWNLWQDESLVAKNKSGLLSFADINHVYSLVRHLNTFGYINPTLIGFSQ